MPGAAAGFAAGVVAGAAGVYCAWRRGARRPARAAAQRHGGVVRLKRDMYDQYTQLHDKVWEGTLKCMHGANIRNFVVYHHEETSLLFYHFEYIGTDFARDMAALGSDPQNKLWWSYCEPCHEPFDPYFKANPPPSQGGTGAWWAPLTLLCSCGGWPTAWSDALYDPDFVPKNPHGKTSTPDAPPPVHNRPE